MPDRAPGQCAPSQPLVSVFVLCYNQAHYVVETLESVRRQTYQNIQLIVADDCSRDESLAIVRQWIADHEVPCEVIAHARNMGICRTLNEALSLARGQYVAIVAGDDIWLPEKLEKQVAALESASPEVGVVYSDAWRADLNGNRLPGMFIANHRTFADTPDGDIFETLIDGNFIPACTPLVRASCYERVGRYDERLAYEDWDMWLRLAAAFKFVYLPWPSGVYRVVPGSLVQRLSDRNGRGLTSDFLTLEGLLALDRVDGELRRTVVTRICAVAESLYRMDVATRQTFLWRARRLRPSLRMALMCVMSLFHVPYAMFRRCDVFHTSGVRRALA